MQSKVLLSPKWRRPFVDKTGVPTPIAQGWIDSVTQLHNSNSAELSNRISELEPEYRVVRSSDSPVLAMNNDYILAKMDGDITIVPPSSGRFSLTRDGSGFTLAISGTVEGEVNPVIVSDGDSPTMAYIGEEWRYV